MFQPISARQRCSFCILPKRSFNLSEATTTNSSEVPRPKSRLAVKVLHKKKKQNRTQKKTLKDLSWTTHNSAFLSVVLYSWLDLTYLALIVIYWHQEGPLTFMNTNLLLRSEESACSKLKNACRFLQCQHCQCGFAPWQNHAIKFAAHVRVTASWHIMVTSKE